MIRRQSQSRMDRVQPKPALMEYLSELVRSQLENRKPAAVPDELSVEQLEQIAVESHMSYIILGALMKLDIDEKIKERFKPRIIHSTMKTLQQVCSAKDIQDAFEQAGIRNQVLKGAVMKHIYPRPEQREMSDIDFMVYEESFDKAEAILLEKGYSKDRAVKHHVIFRKNPFLIFEMHWSLYEQTVDKGQYLYYKDKFRAKLKEGCQYTYEFSKEDFYVYLISHMAKHFYENGCGIRNLLDIYVYLGKYGNELDMDIVNQELETCGLKDFEYHTKKLADIWLGNKESTEFYNHMFLYMLDCGIYGKSENGVWGQLAKIEADVKEKDKEKQVSYFFPSLKYMVEYYPWLERFRFLLPVAWFHRGIHGLFSRDSRNRMKLIGDEDKTDIILQIYQELNLDFGK